MGCGKKTEPIDTATNSATLEMAGTHWQLTVDDQGNAVWTAARSAGAEGPDTDRARDLKLSASVDVSELATDPMACENPDQASFSDFVPSSVRAVIRNCPMELDEAFLTAPPGERPPCRAFHPSAVKAFKIQTRLNATTIAQDEAKNKKADQVEAVERSAAVLHEFQGGAIDGGGDGGLLLKNLDLDLFREKLLDKLGADWGRPTPELLQAQTTAEEAKAKHQARQAKGALETRMLEPITPPFSAWPSEVRVAIETGVFEPTTAWRDFSMDLTSLTDSCLGAKAVILLGRNPGPGRDPHAKDGALVRRAQVLRALISRPPSPGLWRDELRCRGPDKPGHQGPGGAALGPALDDEQTGRRGPHLCGPLGPTTGPGTRPGLGKKTSLR